MTESDTPTSRRRLARRPRSEEEYLQQEIEAEHPELKYIPTGRLIFELRRRLPDLLQAIESTFLPTITKEVSSQTQAKADAVLSDMLDMIDGCVPPSLAGIIEEPDLTPAERLAEVARKGGFLYHFSPETGKFEQVKPD